MYEIFDIMQLAVNTIGNKVSKIANSMAIVFLHPMSMYAYCMNLNNTSVLNFIQDADYNNDVCIG